MKKDTTATVLNTSSLTGDRGIFQRKILTNELRWVWRDRSDGYIVPHKVLQQKWEIYTHQGLTTHRETEWRDVPVIDETEITPTK